MTALPNMIAPSDAPTFRTMSTPAVASSPTLIRFTLSKAKEDIVVRDPQKPIPMSRVYRSSRPRLDTAVELAPKIRLPRMLIIRTEMGRPP